MSLNISNFESAELDIKSLIVLVTDVNVLLHSNNQSGVEKTHCSFQFSVTSSF